MRHRIVAMTGLTALAVFSLALAGCNTDEGDSTVASGKTATSGTADAAQEITDAAAKTNKTTFKLTLTSGMATGSGLADPAGKKSQLTIDVGAAGSGTKMELRMIDKDLWMKVPGMPASKGKWMHLDVAKMPASFGSFGTAGDPGSSLALVKAVKEVESLGDGNYKGTLDLAKSPSSQSLMQEIEKQSIGPELLIVPFEATVDKDGRLAEITIDQSALIKAIGGDAGAGIAAAAGRIEMTFSDFGAKVDIAAPAANEVTEIPADLLKLLGG